MMRANSRAVPCQQAMPAANERLCERSDDAADLRCMLPHVLPGSAKITRFGRTVYLYHTLPEAFALSTADTRRVTDTRGAFSQSPYETMMRPVGRVCGRFGKACESGLGGTWVTAQAGEPRRSL